MVALGHEREDRFAIKESLVHAEEMLGGPIGLKYGSNGVRHQVAFWSQIEQLLVPLSLRLDSA